MDEFSIKTSEELKVMEEGGKKLSFVKHDLISMIAPGVSAYDLEKRADDLINKMGGKPSFKMVPGYSWATCVNTNSGIVHGIPSKDIVFKDGDVVSVDLGMYYKGFHTDTSDTIAINPNEKVKNFLEAGKKAFFQAVKMAKPGKRIYDISEAIEDVITLFGYTPIRDLVGHGIGKNLHEEPEIPNYICQKRDETMLIQPGMAIAIEVMYAMGDYKILQEKDGWTIRMRDDKISALFEDTIVITQKGAKIITG